MYQVLVANGALSLPRVPGSRSPGWIGDFLIQNAKFFLDEYHVNGFRYDQVSVIDHDGAPHGWRFCQDLTSTLRHHRPGAFDKAEYWNVNPYVVKAPPELVFAR